MIANNLKQCLSKKAREKHEEYDFSLQEDLRSLILKDVGNSALREKALRFIEKLQKENEEAE